MVAAIIIALCGLFFAGMVWMIVLVVRDTTRQSGNWGINTSQPTSCPSCGAPLPTVRIPKNGRQMLWGGWTCERCHCEIDKWGKVLS